MNQTKMLTFENNLNNIFSNQYVVPIYQRGYAWEEAEIHQMLSDIIDVGKDKNCQNYHVGTLVVFPKSLHGQTVYEVIDGQQRLTTFFILLTVLKKEFKENELIKAQMQNNNTEQFLTVNLKDKLFFESRKDSMDTLHRLQAEGLKHINEPNSLETAYQIMTKFLKNNLNDFDNFITGLKKVRLLRVEVPHDTDLNHYFEIMNSRGEQLEKHEIIKAHCMSILQKSPNLKEDQKDKQKTLFHYIWESCSDMNRYIQYSFDTNVRSEIFGTNWDNVVIKDFGILSLLNFKEITPKTVNDKNPSDSKPEPVKNLNYIIENSATILAKDLNQDTKEEGKLERFSSVVNFPNFLLLVLKVMKGTEDKDIPLDDKKLEPLFKANITSEKDVQEFGIKLLMLRFLFDKFVIKRDDVNNKKSSWSLKLLKYENNSPSYINTLNETANKQLIMLESMFHVSNPNQNYKNWLYAVIKFLDKNSTNDNNELLRNEIIGENLYNYLSNQSKLWMSYYLSNNKKDFDKLIHEQIPMAEFNKSMLNRGTQVESYIFNYLDFILWNEDTYKKYVANNEQTKEYIETIKSFEFTSRSSVEHYYPQNPFAEKDSLENIHHFGNLCLISSHRNSALNNRSTEEKKKYLQDKPVESIKQAIMLTYHTWSKTQIDEHGEEMFDIIEASLKQA